MTNVVFLHERFPFGGGETVTATVARALTEARPHDLHITIIAAHVGTKRASSASPAPHVGTRCCALNDTPHIGTRSCALETAPLACPWHQLRHPDGARAFIAQLQAIAPTGILVIPVDPPLGLLEAIRRDLPGWRTIFLLHGTPLWQVQGKTSLSPVKALRERLLHTYTRRYIQRYRRIYDTVDRFAVLCNAYRTQLEQLLGIPPAGSRVIALYNPVQPVAACRDAMLSGNTPNGITDLESIFQLTPMKTTRIAFVMPSYGGGGTERVTNDIAEALIKTGLCSITLMVWHTEPQFVARAQAIGMTVEQLPTSGSPGSTDLYRTPATTEHIAHRLREGAFDMVIMLMQPLVDTGIIRRIAPDCKICFHLHMQPLYEARYQMFVDTAHLSPIKAMWRKLREKVTHRYRKEYIQYYKQLYSSVDQLIVLCDSYRAQLADILGDDARIIALNNPLQPILNKDCNDLVHKKNVLYMGRLDRAQKRIDRLLHAWARIAPARPGWTLKIVGDGPDRTRLEALATELGITSSVQFCGYTSDPTPYYREASIMTLTSEYEGWPCVLLEGMSAGVVPVAMDCCAGVAEILADGRGILTPPADVDAFARALAGLIDDPARTYAMRPECIRFTERFTPEATATVWLQLIDTLTRQ